MAQLFEPSPAPAQQPPVNQPRTVVVNVLVVSKGADGSETGFCTPVSVTAGGAEGSKVRVGFFETEAGGTGDSWRSAGWTAAITAALLSDFDPARCTSRLNTKARSTAPAPALMTIGVLAAVRGDTPNPNAAMTGTINPDGTIGPVGGIRFKIEGAAEKGMKLVLIPAGIRSERDANGEPVDLIDHGRKLGVDVRPVLDIYTAYEILTGATLPRAPDARLPHVSLEAQRQVQKKIDAWYKLYSTALDAYTKMPGQAKLSQECVDLYKQGLDIIQHAQKMAAEGEVSAAFWDHVHAAIYAYLALEAGRYRTAYADGGYSGAVKRVRNNDWLEKEIEQMAGRMREETPKTSDQLLMYFHACDAFLEALALQYSAKELLAKLPADETDAANAQAMLAASYQIISWLDLKAAGDYLDLGAGYGGTLLPARAAWRDIGDFLRRASEANNSVFDALIIKEGAKAAALGVDQYRHNLMQKDMTYGLLHTASESIFPRLKDYFGDGDAYGYAYLSTSLYVHTRAASLLAKYYSLGAELDDEANITAIGRERTLGDWLEFAEDQTRRDIAWLSAHGVDATPSVQVYEIARICARRDLPNKLEALTHFWAADLHAQVLRRVANVGADAK